MAAGGYKFHLRSASPKKGGALPVAEGKIETAKSSV